MITKIAFVAHPTRDITAARRFWGELLGLRNSSNYGDAWAEFDTPEGKTIALDTFSPEGTHPYLALETDGIEAEVARLRDMGVQILKDIWDNEVCKMALVADPFGHGVMLHQIEPKRLAAMTKQKATPKARPSATKKAKVAKPAPRRKPAAKGKAGAARRPKKAAAKKARRR